MNLGEHQSTLDRIHITTLPYLVHAVHPKSNLTKKLLPFYDIYEHFRLAVAKGTYSSPTIRTS
jgi:hypothetical protein